MALEERRRRAVLVKELVRRLKAHRGGYGVHRLTWLVLLTLAPFALAVLTGGVIGIAYVSFVPAFVLFYGILSETPSGIEVERWVEREKLGVGKEGRVRVRLTVERGSGFVVVEDFASPPGLEVAGRTATSFSKGQGRDWSPSTSTPFAP